jgi:glycosyltransferase involved in cell wall biosynthesis
MAESGHAAAIDVCVPVYNAADYLRETLDSILSQDFSDFRLLLSVDACEDDSLAICRDYARDPRVRVFEHRQRLGFAGNSNFLVRTARSEFMKFAPGDDILAPGMLRRLYEFVQREPECAIAIPLLKGFGQGARDFRQHEVRGPRVRRLLDVIMNQRSVAAYHGLVRLSPDIEDRPMFPEDIPGDHEADVHWMASAVRNGELRLVPDAVVRKRFRPDMTSRIWTPENRREARRLLIYHTSGLTELAWPLCGSEADRRQLILAALVRLWGLGLNWGTGKAGPWSRRTLARSFLQSLREPAAGFAASLDRSGLGRQIRQDQGVVGASFLARQVEREASGEQMDTARKLYRQAIAMDPLAGWAEPFCSAFPGLADTSDNIVTP